MTTQSPNRLHLQDMKNSRSEVLIRQKQLKDYALHWHDCFEIELVLDGHAQHVLNGVSYPIGPGDVYLLRPTDFHAVTLNGPVTVYNLMFSETFVGNEMLDRILTTEDNLACHLNEEDYTDLSALMGQALREFEGDRPYRSVCLPHLLECIFIQVIRQCAVNDDRTTVGDHSLRSTLTYLHGHFRENPSMAQMATQSGFNPCYFSALFHKETGKTYKDYLCDLRLNYAHKLARASTLSVTEICYACGFNSLSHFMRSYKSKFGCTPRMTRGDSDFR